MQEEIYSGVLREARSWFALPDDKKRQIELSPQTHYRGYQPLGANVTRYEGGFVRDWHEGIDLYKEVTPDEAQYLPASPVHGLNQWPVQVPNFAHLLRAYIEACLGLGAAMMRGVALGLDLPERVFEPFTDQSYWVTRVIYYPPLPGHDGGSNGNPGATSSDAPYGTTSYLPRSTQLSCGEHCDYGCWTFVNQEQGVTALQVQNQDGIWVDAPPLPGTFVCNVGDMMTRWTAGEYKSTLHRVVNASPYQDRVSIPFFYEANFDCVVKPLLSSPTRPGRGQEVVTKPVMYGKHLESKVLRNFEFPSTV